MNFNVSHIFADIWHDCIFKEAFANSKECEELKEMITDIARHESMKCLMPMLRQENMMLQEKLGRLQRERVDISNEHAAEIKRIHSVGVADIRISHR
jgi:hypothetical protein